MAQESLFRCDRCDRIISAWSDGNPYYFGLDKHGQFKKLYAYHPSHLFDRCVGNDAPHLCLSCGKEFMVDSEAPITACPKCQARTIVDTMDLGGKPCPFCPHGMFGESWSSGAIS